MIFLIANIAYAEDTQSLIQEFLDENEAVGAVFLLFLTFGMAFFEIITIPTAFAGIVAVIILLAIVTTRKD